VIQDPICVLSELLERWADENRNGRAVIDATGSLTYERLHQCAMEVAGGLCRRGVRPMDRVALLLPDGIDLAIGLFACFRLGAVAVPLAFDDLPERRRYVFRDCEPRLTLVDTFTAGDGEQLFLSELAADASPIDLPPTPTDEDLAVLLYTAGLSAPPKGVMHIHGRLARAALRHARCLGLSQRDVVTTRLSCARASGLMGALLPGIAAGAQVVMGALDPSPLAPLPETEKGESARSSDVPLSVSGRGLGGGVKHATVLLGAPADFDALARLPAPPYDLSDLRLCLATGAALPEAVADAFRRRYGVAIRSAWGTTEAPYACLTSDTGNEKPGSIGLPEPGIAIRLEDGEIWLKSDVAPVGYWNNPAATAALLHDGWVHTGDRAWMDADGRFYLVAPGS
jgi:acyl-CoA synthetase (AMP-forming)/AMP-acid ligase II